MKSSRRLLVYVACLALLAGVVGGVVWFRHVQGPERARAWWQSWRGETKAPDSIWSAAATNSPGMLPAALRERVTQALRDPASVMHAFNAWRQRYADAATAPERAALVAEGVALSAARREVLHEVIALDPELALRLAVPRQERSQLPREVVARLEEPVSGRGDFNVVARLPEDEAAPAGTRAVLREAVIAGRAYEAFVYGRRARLATSRDIGLHGIAIAGRLALLDSPVRLLEAGEAPAAGRAIAELCAISGQPAGPAAATAAAVSPIAADAGDRVYYLCSAGHIAQLEEKLSAQDNLREDYADLSPAVAASAAGIRRILFIRVRFAGDAAEVEPQSQASAETMFAAAADFLRENSFGALEIAAVITPVYTLPQSAAWYQANDTSGYALNVLQAARAIAAQPGGDANAGLPAYDYLEYDFEAVRYQGGPGAFSGQGYVGVRGCWIKSSSAGVLAHELGHNLGLWHANYWEPALSDAPAGPGRNREYGDIFSTMGSSRAGALHFNAAEKATLGWLPAETVAEGATSGVYRLYAHDRGGAIDPALQYALRVPGGDRDYWFEFRQHPGWALNPWLQSGLGVRWDAWSSSNGGTQLLDATPLSRDGKEDSTIALGRTFFDPVTNIHITPLQKNDTVPESLEVDVQLGPFPGNRPPVISVTAEMMQAAVGAAVTLAANASDPDGDALAYAWDFGDRTISSNAATVSHRWMAIGDHRVRVTATDRKGGTASASLVVRVGAATGARVSGTVRDLAGDPVADVRVATDLGSEDVNYREALTDADGSFSLVGVAAGNWTLHATKSGWAFAPLNFTSPLPVTGDTAEADFVGHPTGWRVAGVVRYDDGEPVVGALVSDGTRTEPTDAQGNFAFTGVPAGRYTLQATATGTPFEPVVITVVYADVVVPTITAISSAPAPLDPPAENAAPVFTTAATITSPVNGPYLALAAEATDDGGDARVRYAWSLVGPAPGAVQFSRNSSHGAAETVAQVAAAGMYQFRVTATDATGATSVSDVSVAVSPAVVHLAIEPALITALVGKPVNLSATGIDQFGHATSVGEGLDWSVSGGGTIDDAGVFTPTVPGRGFVVTVRLPGRAASAVIDVGYSPGPGYGLLLERWSNLPGGLVRNLTAAEAYPDAPDEVWDWDQALEVAPSDTENNSGRRWRGFFLPPATGEYVFRIASSHGSELWLGSSADPAGRGLIAEAPLPTGFRQWSALATQRSAPVHLTQDVPVYFEVLHKSASEGGSHLSVGVELPGGVFEGPIPAHRFLPWGADAFGPPRLVTPASAATTLNGGELLATLSALAASDGGEPLLRYTWGVKSPAPGPVVFLPNGTNAAKEASARFARPGRYTLQVTVTDAAHQSVTSSVTLTVPETLATWRQSHFTAGELADPQAEDTRWGVEADPDGDGHSNLLEYAFGLDPLVAETAGAPRPTFVTVDGIEYLAITFRRNPAAADVVFTPQATSDLKTWEGGLIAVGDPEAEEVTYRDTVAAAEFEKRFLRVKVTLP